MTLMAGGSGVAMSRRAGWCQLSVTMGLHEHMHSHRARLLSGDLNIEGSEHLLEDPARAAKMDAHTSKTPHHGIHEFHYPFLEAARPQISSMSSPYSIEAVPGRFPQ